MLVSNEKEAMLTVRRQSMKLMDAGGVTMPASLDTTRHIQLKEWGNDILVPV